VLRDQDKTQLSKLLRLQREGLLRLLSHREAAHEVMQVLNRYTKDKSVAKKAVAKPDYYVAWINIDLSESDKDVLRNELPTEGTCLEGIERWVGEGYKFSATFDAGAGVFVVALLGKGGDNAGKGVSARGRDLHRALAALLYKVDVKLDAVWGSEAGELDDFG